MAVAHCALGRTAPPAVAGSLAGDFYLYSTDASMAHMGLSVSQRASFLSYGEDGGAFATPLSTQAVTDKDSVKVASPDRVITAVCAGFAVFGTPTAVSLYSFMSSSSVWALMAEVPQQAWLPAADSCALAAVAVGGVEAAGVPLTTAATCTLSNATTVVVLFEVLPLSRSAPLSLSVSLSVWVSVWFDPGAHTAAVRQTCRRAPLWLR